MPYKIGRRVFYSVAEIAAATGFSTDGVRLWLRQGLIRGAVQVPAPSPVGYVWLVPPVPLRAFLRQSYGQAFGL